MTLEIAVKQLPEPVLEFGGPLDSEDPKKGLIAAGPFSLRFGTAHKHRVRLGLVGPAEILDRGRRWFERCRRTITSGSSNPSLYPDFPGFHDAFRSYLDAEPTWQIELPAKDYEQILALEPGSRFTSLLDLYAAAIQHLANREVRPDTVVCCLPEEAARSCWSITNSALSRQERKWLRNEAEARARGQLSLFDLWGGTQSLESLSQPTPDDLLFRDFRRALKARAMLVRMPIQVALDHLFVDSENNQDPATRAWNVSVALFYKAGGIPWRLKVRGPETCYVGISFHFLRTRHHQLMYSSLAQAFPTEGDGFALRGDSIPWQDEFARSPHLSEEQAGKLMLRVLDAYRARSGRDPLRVVLHKTSAFDSSEQAGFTAALKGIPTLEMVNLRSGEFRLVRRGTYPPQRGTVCLLGGEATYLFTTGFIPFWGTYPGPHVPVPYEISGHRISSIEGTCIDILGLTKMNWNSATAVSAHPITLRFARKVGGIMAELPPDAEPNPSYRYYI
jgi:hypothetical protein